MKMNTKEAIEFCEKKIQTNYINDKDINRLNQVISLLQQGEKYKQKGGEKMSNTVVNCFCKYFGKNWVLLQNGENIIFAKRSVLKKLKEDDKEDEYAILYDKKTKTIEMNVSDVDVIFFKK